MTVQSQSKFLSMPRIIIRLILDQLYADSPESLLSFRLACKICRHESKYIAFRTTKIYGTIDKPDTRCRDRLNSITRDNGDVLSYIQHLVLGPFVNESSYLREIAPQLEYILGGIDNLKSVTWRGTGEVYPDALDVLYTLRPDIPLHVVIKYRAMKPLAARLLLSPQLTSLNIAIYHPVSTGQIMGRGGELSFVGGCIQNSPRLHALTVTIAPISTARDFRTLLTWDYVQSRRAIYPECEDELMPGPDELVHPLQAQLQHAVTPRTPWAQLRRLELGAIVPKQLVSALDYRVVRLEAISLAFQRDGHESYECASNADYLSFLRYVPVLRELRCTMPDRRTLGKLLQLVLKAVGRSLWVLEVKVLLGEYNWGTNNRVVELLRLAPGLRELRAVHERGGVKGVWSGEDVQLDAETKARRVVAVE